MAEVIHQSELSLRNMVYASELFSFLNEPFSFNSAVITTLDTPVKQPVIPFLKRNEVVVSKGVMNVEGIEAEVDTTTMEVVEVAVAAGKAF